MAESRLPMSHEEMTKKKRRGLSDDEKTIIHKMRREGHPQKHIAEVLGRARQTIQYYCVRNRLGRIVYTENSQIDRIAAVEQQLEILFDILTKKGIL